MSAETLDDVLADLDRLHAEATVAASTAHAAAYGGHLLTLTGAEIRAAEEAAAEAFRNPKPTRQTVDAGGTVRLFVTASHVNVPAPIPQRPDYIATAVQGDFCLVSEADAARLVSRAPAGSSDAMLTDAELLVDALDALADQRRRAAQAAAVVVHAAREAGQRITGADARITATLATASRLDALADAVGLSDPMRRALRPGTSPTPTLRNRREGRPNGATLSEDQTRDVSRARAGGPCDEHSRRTTP